MSDATECAAPPRWIEGELADGQWQRSGGGKSAWLAGCNPVGLPDYTIIVARGHAVGLAHKWCFHWTGTTVGNEYECAAESDARIQAELFELAIVRKHRPTLVANVLRELIAEIGPGGSLDADALAKMAEDPDFLTCERRW